MSPSSPSRTHEVPSRPRDLDALPSWRRTFGSNPARPRHGEKPIPMRSWRSWSPLIWEQRRSRRVHTARPTFECSSATERSVVCQRKMRSVTLLTALVDRGHFLERRRTLHARIVEGMEVQGGLHPPVERLRRGGPAAIEPGLELHARAPSAGAPNASCLWRLLDDHGGPHMRVQCTDVLVGPEMSEGLRECLLVAQPRRAERAP